MKTSLAAKQNGSTLTGFILGLVLGLAIALVVAMVITKTPTPFMNKVGKVEKPESETIQDPNRSLHGGKEQAPIVLNKEVPKAAANEANKDAVKEPAKDAAKEVKPKTAEPVTQPGGAYEPPTVDKKNAKTTEHAAEKTEGDEKSTYYLQVGAYKDFNAAEASRAKLTLLGVEAKIVEKPSDGGPLFQVRVGPYHQVDAMSKMRSRLSENGVDVAIVKIMK